MKKTIGIVLLGVVVAASAALYWRHVTAAQSDVPELLLYAPPGAQAIVYIDLVALRSSAFAADLTALGPAQHPDREYLEFVAATGFDFARDLDRAVFLVYPLPPAQVSVVVAEGRFDRAKIAAYASRSGSRHIANGIEVYEIPQPGSGKKIALTFLEGNRIALAQGSTPSAALESVVRHDRDSALDPELHARLLRVAGSPLFAAGQVNQLPENAAPGGIRSDQLNALVQEIRWATIGMRPEGELLHVAADGECANPENARQLAGTLDGLQLLGQSIVSDPKTRAKMPPQTAALLDAVLRDLRVSQEGSRVRLTLEVTHDQFRDILRGQTAPAAAR